MISSFSSSIFMVLVFGISYLFLKRRLITSKFYFVLLFLMGAAGIVLPLDKYVQYYSQNYNAAYILLFSILVIMTLIPWLKFDKAFSNWGMICIKEKYIGLLKIVFFINIVLGLYAIIYSFPYALMALSMGADDVRQFIADESFYPKSILTTVCVGIGYLTPIQILLFYISLLHYDLRKYSILLFITSLSYLITMLPYAARDGFIFLPLTYFFMYKVFSPSLPDTLKLRIRKYALVLGGIISFGVLFISYQRFYLNAKSGLSSFDSMIYGTWGYFFQQPFVFEQTISYDVSYYGFDRRFELLNNIFSIPKHIYLLDSLTTSFGTMYSEFYNCYGWSSLIGFSLFYYISFSVLLGYHIERKHYLSILLVFIIYLYYTISGLFYYKMYLISVTELYLVILFFSLFISNVLTVSKINPNDKKHYPNINSN